jgi:hypothetical protein
VSLHDLSLAGSPTKSDYGAIIRYARSITIAK